MASIIIGFSKSKKPTMIGRIIAWLEMTEYTHVYLLANNLIPAKVVLHADTYNVHIISEKNFLINNHVVKQFEVKLNREELASFMTMALDLVGKPYSYRQLATIGFNRIMKMLNFKFRLREIKVTNAIICSELIERFLKEIKGIDIRESPDAITPRDIYKICLELGLPEV
jgi:uncharacterized protein YycO